MRACLPVGPGASQRRLVPAPVLRGQLLYRRPFYLYLMASNLALRLSWAYKLSPHLRDHHVVVSLVALAEAFRHARVVGFYRVMAALCCVVALLQVALPRC